MTFMSPFIRRLAGRIAVLLAAGTLAACAVESEQSGGYNPGPRPWPAEERMCTREYAPVCGVRGGDRRTFGNACEARSNGYDIIGRGACMSGRPDVGWQDDYDRPRDRVQVGWDDGSDRERSRDWNRDRDRDRDWNRDRDNDRSARERDRDRDRSDRSDREQDREKPKDKPRRDKDREREKAKDSDFTVQPLGGDPRERDRDRREQRQNPACAKDKKGKVVNPDACAGN